jgi:hypothetical protein
MRRHLVLMAAGALALGIYFGLLTAGTLSAVKGRPEAKGGPQPPLKPDRITTAVLPPDLVTLRVRLGSKPNPQANEPGSKQTPRMPTVWDGQLRVSGGQVRSLRLWQDDPRDALDELHWKLSTRHTTPWSTEERKRGHDSLPMVEAALVI